MNLRDIRYLVTVADLRHFGKAAIACNVSQPTLSMQLKKLEDTLGVSLFERSNRTILLTLAGEVVVRRAREVLASCEQMVQAAKAAQDPFAGEITLGVFPTLAPYLLPLVMPTIGKTFPKLSVNLIEEKTDTLLERIELGHIDCALLAQPVRSTHLESQTLFEEPFMLAVPKAHALAQRKRIQLSDLDGHTLLLLDEGHCLREQALSICQRIGAQESQHFRATSLETLRQMVAAGTAMTLIPKLAVQPGRTIHYIPFVNPPSRHIALFYRKSDVRVELMKQLANTISVMAKKHISA